MWFHFSARLPYHQDPDFRDSIVRTIKVALGEATPVDVTLFESWNRLVILLAKAGTGGVETPHRLLDRLLGGFALIAGTLWSAPSFEQKPRVAPI